ncbi:YadA family autotransporter adhesin [Trinickia sp. YCB016]
MNKVYGVVRHAVVQAWHALANTAQAHGKRTRKSAGFAAVLISAATAGSSFAGEACQPEDDNENGICAAAASPDTAVRSASLGATLDDTYVKVNHGGPAATASGTNAIAIGNNARASTGAGNVAIGDSAWVNNTGEGVIVIGRNAVVGSSKSNPGVTGEGTVLIGDGAYSFGDANLVAGYGAFAHSGDSIVLGGNAMASGEGATVVGYDTTVSAASAVAVGAYVSLSSPNTVAIGTGAAIGINSANSTAIGNGATVSGGTNAVALGSGSLATQSNTVSVGKVGGERRIVNVNDGVNATDAVNVRQLKLTNDAVTQNTVNIAANSASIDALGNRVTVNEGDISNLQSIMAGLESGSLGLVQQDPVSGSITVAQGTGGSTVSFAGTGGARRLTNVANGTDDSDAVTLAQLKATGLVDPTGKALGAVVYDDLTLASVTLGGVGGTVLDNVAPGLIAANSMQAVNGGQFYTLQQNVDGWMAAVGDQMSHMDSRVTLLEQNPAATGGSDATNNAAVTPADDWGNASGANSMAAGQTSSATGSNSTAAGQGASASGSNATAIGQGSSATGANSVALGAGSVADRAQAVSVGSAGNERQITNVAPGTAATDAVNLQQMNNSISSARKDAFGGTAAAMAVAGLPQPTAPGKSMVSVAGSGYGGQAGMAIGVSHVTRDNKWVIKASGNTSSRGEYGVVAGGGYQW